MLDNIDGASISDEKVRARIKGEAKFLRAYYHFLLVQGWYEVPIRKETVKDITVRSLEATPPRRSSRLDHSGNGRLPRYGR